MATKRAAEKVMTHDNWDDEEEPEEIGEFKKASEDTMKLRVVRTAKRRNAATPNSNSIFSSFKGFCSAPSIQPSPGTFDFLKNISKPTIASEGPATSSLTSKATGLGAAQKLSPTISQFGQKSLTSSVESKSVSSSSASDEQPAHASKRIKSDDTESQTTDSQAKKPAEYTEADQAFFNKIEQLNAKILKFCTEKFASNPHIIFNPTFQDYRNYVTKYVREKIEHESKLKMEKEKGYDFLSKNMPPVGQSAKVTFLINEKTNETKTFEIGNSDGAFGRSSSSSSSIATSSNSKEVVTKPLPFSSGTLKLGSPAVGGAPPPPSVSSSNPLLSKKDFNIVDNSAKNEEKTVSSAPSKVLEMSQTPIFGGFTSTGGSNPLLSKKDFDTLNSSTKEENEGSSGGLANSSKSNANFSFGLKNEVTKSSSTFSFGLKNDEKNENVPTTTLSSPFSFGFKNGEKPVNAVVPPSSLSSFSFGLASKAESTVSCAASKATFSFGSSSSSSTNGASTENEKTEDVEDDVLPKEQVKEVLEEDSIFTIKCKVFIKKPDNSFADRGVGNLFVKCVEEKVKCQLVVRAVTDTGKIILNVVVTKNVPVKMDKNNLILVCVPHPTTDKSPEPCVCIVKVKTKEDNEKLLKCLEDFRH